MKYIVALSSVCFLLLLSSARGLNSHLSKSTEKISYPKKVTSLKKRPMKLPQANTNTTLPTKINKWDKNIAEAFKNLSEDDLEFINELDRQYKSYGDKIRIKIENNATDTKNLKRTIDVELGYGYNNNGYEYSRPKFMFYPYSQNDIPKSMPGYYQNYDKTSVTIEPSYSYELKPQTYKTAIDHALIDLPQQHFHRAHHQQEGSQQQYDDPIIVLRIPGPTKYASHIQTLLQQYLEIRAAQYLRILEQQDLQKQQPDLQTNQQNQYHQPQVNIQQEKLIQPARHHYYQTKVEVQSHPTQSTIAETSEVVYAHPVVSIPQSSNYPDIQDVYQNYKGDHEVEVPKHQMADYYEEAEALHAATSQLQQQEKLPQYLVTSAKQYAETDIAHGYPMYIITMVPKSDYNKPPTIEDDKATNNGQAHLKSLHISENNPRKTHTKIVFTNGSEKARNEYVRYPLPSIRPFDRIEPTSIAPYHQQYQPQSEIECNSDDSKQQDVYQNTVTITQRPYNYHAHTRKMKLQDDPKRMITAADIEDDTNEKLQKIRSYVQKKFGAQPGSAIEYQTST